jgi:hypothetical protein
MMVSQTAIESGHTNSTRSLSRRASRLHQRLGAIAVEAFPGGKGFGGKAAVNGRFKAQHKLAAKFFCSQRFG